jgi:hypothetical protein
MSRPGNLQVSVTLSEANWRAISGNRSPTEEASYCAHQGGLGAACILYYPESQRRYSAPASAPIAQETFFSHGTHLTLETHSPPNVSSSTKSPVHTSKTLISPLSR